MHLFAALVPPQEVLDDVLEAVGRVKTPPDGSASVPPEPQPVASRTRVFGRRHSPSAPVPPAAPAPRPLDVVAPEAMYLPLAKFGHLIIDQAAMLAHALQREAESLRAPQLRLAGGVALEWSGDQSAWVGLAGDLDALDEIAQAVPRVAQWAQLFVDRRTFRPFLKVGTINDHTTVPYLEELLATLEEYDGPPWSQTVISLLVPGDPSAGQPPFRSFREVSLAVD